MPRKGPLIDMSQARRIAETTIAMEFRRHGGNARRRGTGFVVLVLTYLVAGVFVGALFRPGADPFTLGFIACSVLMVFLLTFVAVEFTLIVLSPEDHSFYLPLPVSAWTFVTSKLLVLCFLTVAFALAFAVPFLNMAAFRGVPLPAIGGLLYSLVLSAIIVTLFATLLLGGALRLVPSRWVSNAAVYLQLATLFLFYGGFAVVQGVRLGALSSVRISFAPVVLLAPSSWGPSILLLGSTGALAMVAVSLSLLAPPLLFVACVRILAPFLEGRVTELSERPRRQRSSLRRSFLWRTPEERAVALLIRSHLRYDPQFRLGILMTVVLTAIMLIVTVVINRAPILDPFTPEGRASFASTFVIYLAIVLFPFTVKTTITHSREAEASWLITASPADRALLLRAVRRFTQLFFVIPYLLVLGAVFLLFTRSLVHTMQHFAMVAALVLVEADALLFLMPELPFSKKTDIGAGGAQIIAQFIPAAVGLLVLYLLVTFAYASPYLYWPALGGLLACGAALRLFGPRHAAARLASVEAL